MTTTAGLLQPHLRHELAHVRRLIRYERRGGQAALAELFAAGTAPDAALTGRFLGRFEAFKVGPGLSQLGEFVDRTWHPWQGKVFDGSSRGGINLLRHDTFTLMRLLAPTYDAFQADTATTFRAFSFQTFVAPARDNPALLVLKIDYNVPVNPSWSVRRILDELVQLDEGLFLGKAYIKWWWGTWQQWAFFSLEALPPEQGNGHGLG